MVGSILRKSSMAAVVGVTAAMVNQVGLAAGFAIQEKSVTALGRAYAGNSLPGDDASAASYNPADMVNSKKQTHLQIGATYVTTDVEVEGSFDPSPLSCVTCSGAASTNESAWIPLVNLVHRLNDRMSVGLSINSPFGLGSDYGDNWFGRYSSTLSEMKVVDVNPSLAVKVNDRVSFGFGVSYQHVSAELKQKLHPSALAGLLLQNGDITVGQVPAFTSATQGTAELDGDDDSWGFNLGLTWSITDTFSTSIAYRSEVSHTIGGDQVVSGYTAGGAFATSLNTSTGGKTDIVLPESLNISVLFDVSERWSVMASTMYMGWSSFDEIRVDLDSGMTSVEPQDWDNVWAFSIGASVRVFDSLDLRWGYLYDPSPVPGSHLRSAKIPDTDRDFYSIGFSWHLNERMTIDGAYAFNHGESADLKAGDYAGSPGTFDAEIEKSDAHLVGLQFQYYW